MINRKLNDLWSKAILTMYPRCHGLCGGRVSVDAHHMLPKGSYPAYRYRLDVGVGLCFECHRIAHAMGLSKVHEAIYEEIPAMKRHHEWLRSRYHDLTAFSLGLPAEEIIMEAIDFMKRGSRPVWHERRGLIISTPFEEAL